MSTESYRTWKAIWDRRRIAPTDSGLLADLIVADGFDTGFGSYPAADWQAMVADVVRLTAITGSSRVLEIGCGAGALLYELHRQTGCEVFGLDYSAALIAEARRHLPFGTFAHLEATGLPQLPGGFDVILSHSVFFYFPDHRYVSEVLAAAFDKLAPGGVLCLQDLNDLAQKQEYETHRRRTYRNPDDYERDYAGLAHLFFDKDAMRQELRRLGFEQVRLFAHASRGYANTEFRFNVLARKPASPARPG